MAGLAQQYISSARRNRRLSGVDRMAPPHGVMSTRFGADHPGGVMLRGREPNRRGTWTAQRLQAWLNGPFGGERIVVLANREPFMHDREADGGIVVRRSASGLVTALEPLMQACGGVWVAHGGGSADRAVVDRRDGLDVPPADPHYRLRRVWLDRHEYQGYYYGFANEALWPLCHRAHVQPVFRSADFDTYRAVNVRFADAVCDEADRKSPLVLVQDYHFALAPRLIHDRLPLSTIVAFWHIPWPAPRDFEICPWAGQLLHGLLGSGIVGFQTTSDCTNFIDTVEAFLEAQIDREHGVITYAGRQTMVRAYPVSIEWPNRWVAGSAPIEVCRSEVRRQLDLESSVRLGVGVDRLDYTKGIEEKFLAVERLLESRPELVGRFAFVQLAEPSRDCLPAYRDLRVKVLRTAEGINLRFGAGAYRPIIVLEDHHEPEEVYRFLRAADLCYVGSLHDGMNLVAKEFVSAREDERGVLILSRFTGAARQLADALLVNPYAIDDSAQVLSDALNMCDDEQSRRMRRMRSAVAEFSTYWWAGQMLQDAARLRQVGRGDRSTPHRHLRVVKDTAPLSH
jgi:trehalose 6-phosphate synthase